jgi:HD-GYP domain-containing protein (c-di-GMP phosphodiesterase class II)
MPGNNSDADLDALLSLDLNDLDEMGGEDKTFAGLNEAPPAAKALPPDPIALLKAKLAASAPAFPPQGTAWRVDMPAPPIERIPAHKAALVRALSAATQQVREAYDLICLGDYPSAAPMSALVGALAELLRKDSPAVLALCLTREGVASDYLHRHAVNVSVLTMATALMAGCSREGVLDAGLGALLADVGMRMVPEDILNKQGRLSPEELAEIHRHTRNTLELLAPVTGISDAALAVVYQHHERLSGAGYPEKVAGDAITHPARMAAIADTLAAMVHSRSHRAALAPEAGLERVLKMAQMQLLDFDHARHLARLLGVTPVGTYVELSGGRLGRVVAVVEDPQRPCVAILKTPDGRSVGGKPLARVDLKKNPTEKILRCVPASEAGFQELDGF